MSIVLSQPISFTPVKVSFLASWGLGTGDLNSIANDGKGGREHVRPRSVGEAVGELLVNILPNRFLEEVFFTFMPTFLFPIICPSGPVLQTSFKRWIALSTGQIAIQRLIIAKTNCAIGWRVIYPVDSAIHLLNN